MAVKKTLLSKKPIKKDIKALHNFYWIKKQILVHVRNTKKLHYIKPVKEDMKILSFFLFDHGADIKFFDNKKQTPLHIAGYSGNNSNMQI